MIILSSGRSILATSKIPVPPTQASSRSPAISLSLLQRVRSVFVATVIGFALQSAGSRVAICEEPINVKSLKDKLTLEQLEKLAGRATSGRSTNLSSDERRELVSALISPDLDQKLKRKTMLVLFLSLLNSQDRAIESLEFNKDLRKLISEDDWSETSSDALTCIAFACEDTANGQEVENGLFDDFGSKSNAMRGELLVALNYTRWREPKKRFERLKSMYDDETTSDEVREGIIRLVCSAVAEMRINLRKGCNYLRELSISPKHDAKLTPLMFKLLSEVGELSDPTKSSTSEKFQ